MLVIVDLEERVPRDHPLRRIKVVADAALDRLSLEFDRMYACAGRASVSPERLLNEDLAADRLVLGAQRARLPRGAGYNLSCRWFLNMDPMEHSFAATVFTKNRHRLMAHDVGRALFEEVVWAADGEGLLSNDHFSVDGTRIEAAASPGSSGPGTSRRRPHGRRSGQSVGGLLGKHRSNKTHVSTTDPEESLLRKGPVQESKLAFLGHALMGNRHGLLMDFTVSLATGTAERDAVLELLDGVWVRGYRPRTLGPTAATTPRTV